MNIKTPVSGRQFAKMVGQAESAVRKAVSRQSIVAGRNAAGKFIPEIAAREWGKVLIMDCDGNPIASGPVKQVRQVVKPATVKPVVADKPVKRGPKPKEKPLPVTADEFLHEDDGDLPTDITKDEIEGDPMALTEKSTKVDADRVQAIYKAKMAELAYLERRGDMIPFAKVDKVLFLYGGEIRNIFEALPVQVIDEVRSKKERHEALRVLNEAVNNALEILTDVQNRKF